MSYFIFFYWTTEEVFFNFITLDKMFSVHFFNVFKHLNILLHFTGLMSWKITISQCWQIQRKLNSALKKVKAKQIIYLGLVVWL